MEIQLKVPHVEKNYSTLSVVLIIIRIPLFLAFGFFWIQPTTKPFSIVFIVGFLAATIGNTYIKKYKEIGSVILGYHSVSIDGKVYLLREMMEFYIRIETEAKRVRTPLPTFLTGAENFIIFYINNTKHSYRLLLNGRYVEALEFLSKQWTGLYGRKIGWLLFK